MPTACAREAERSSQRWYDRIVLPLFSLVLAAGAITTDATASPPAAVSVNSVDFFREAQLTLSTEVVAPSTPAEGPPRDPPAKGALFYPDGPGRLAWRLGVGGHVDILPRRIVQSEQRQIPQVVVQARVGLPVGFSAQARLAAIVINNQLEVGAAWTYDAGPVALSVHDHQGFWIGTLGVQGFDATGWGFLNKPGISVGLPMGSVRFTLTGELIYTFGQHVRLGADNLARGQLVFAGAGLTLMVENLLDSGGLWYFGVGLFRTTPNYQAWLAFSDERYVLPYPRLLGGYAF
jgi:hypothetical protein